MNRISDPCFTRPIRSSGCLDGGLIALHFFAPIWDSARNGLIRD